MNKLDWRKEFIISKEFIVGVQVRDAWIRVVAVRDGENLMNSSTF